MKVSILQRRLADTQRQIALLLTQKSVEMKRSAEETKRQHAANGAADRATNDSARQSKRREAQRYADGAIRCQKKVAEIESNIARRQTQLNETEQQLINVQAREAQARAQGQERATRLHNREMQAIAGTIGHHEQLHAIALSAIEKLQRLPDRISVLFLASNPLDQAALRLDEEVRSISEMIRKSDHRDAVQLDSRWAVRPPDVLQAINECMPTIVHFSGHGSMQDEIVFQDDLGRTRLVPKDAIVQAMAATSGEIQLVFFNTCFSRDQAEAVVAHVPAAIGMNASIGDEAARVFAAQFYSSIGFGHSVGKAFKQAQAALMLEGIPEHSTPVLFMARGLEADELVLVKASGDKGVHDSSEAVTDRPNGAISGSA